MDFSYLEIFYPTQSYNRRKFNDMLFIINTCTYIMKFDQYVSISILVRNVNGLNFLNHASKRRCK